MTATILPTARTVFLDTNSNPLSGGKVYFYVPPATTTPKTTWQDAGQSVANSNPVVLDGNGSALIYGSGQYLQEVRDSSGNLIYSGLTQDVYGLITNGNNTFSGNNNFPTQFSTDSSTLVATTAFVQANSVMKTVSASRDISLASGTQAVSGLGFQPKFVMFNAALNTSPSISWGQDDGATPICLFNATASFSIGVQGGSSIFIQTSGGNNYAGKITSFNTDGFVITWTKAGTPTGTAFIQLTAMR